MVLLSDYHYDLPHERIAAYPLDNRSDSKLLSYRDGAINHFNFSDISELIPSESLVVFNDTRVIPARLIMHRQTGARIEIFLLKPLFPHEITQAMKAESYCSWACMIGNKKKWKEGETLSLRLKISNQTIYLHAKLIDREQNYVELSWEMERLSFAELIEAAGKLPLPPYIKREATEADREQYQTVYAEHQGAVAAPKAGLHFTKKVLTDLEAKGIEREFVTLHVGAGTFQPVKHEVATEHPMHAEQLSFTRQNLEILAQKAGEIIAVGTTAMRVLESLYWFGVKVMEAGPSQHQPELFKLDQDYAYSHSAKTLPSAKDTLEILIFYMDKFQLKSILAETSIYIIPGYDFKLCRGLITNFHLPETTLMLLVAAFVGEDWKRIYEEAMENDYRFLSYGDSSFLWRPC